MNDVEMIPCDEVVARLWEYVDGELDPPTAARIRAHLDVCARCFPQYDFQRAYREFVRRTARSEMPPELRRKVFQAILEEERKPRWRRALGRLRTIFIG